MIRLDVVYGEKVKGRTYKTLKAAKSAFASRLLDRSHPDLVQLTVDGVLVAAFGGWF